MYNRYIPNGATYQRIPEEEAPPFLPPEQEPPTAVEPSKAEPAGQAPTAVEKPAGHTLTKLLKGLDLKGIDTGDVLLLLILLFLFLDGNDTELLITLGLAVLLGLK